MEQKNLELD